MKSKHKTVSLWLAGLSVAAAVAAKEPEPPAMFGNTPSRNMVSSEKGLPAKFNTSTGENVLWVSELGSQSYGGPVVYDGVVYVGTNNQREYNPKLKGDRGNVMAFDASTGKLLWQSAHPKLGAGRVNDWPLQGVCSTPYIEGERLWYVSNRAEVIAADTRGFTDGENDGAVKDEAEQGPIDEDVLWRFDMIGELDVFPHNLAAGSPLIVGDTLYTLTGQGVDEGHVNVPAPTAPSLIALDRNTGALIFEHNEPGDKILHGTWSNPSYGVIGGVPQVIYPAGNGWVYALDPKTGKTLWSFDLNPKDAKWVLGGSGTRSYVIATAVVYDGLVYVAVGQDPEHGEGPGHLWAIDPAGKSGDITASGGAWHLGGEDFHRTLSTVAVVGDLLYASDLSGFLYGIEAKTGKKLWTYDAFAAIWGSPFAADGRIYLGDEDGDLAVLQQGRQLKLLFEGNLGAGVQTTPAAKDGVLYVVSRTKLYALKDGIPGKPKPEPAKPAAAPAEP